MAKIQTTQERDKDMLIAGFKHDIDCLKAALKAVVSDILEYERVNNLSPAPGRKYCWDSVARACSLLGDD